MLKKVAITLFLILVSICFFSAHSYATTVTVSYDTVNWEYAYFAPAGGTGSGWTGLMTAVFNDPDFTSPAYCVDIMTSLHSQTVYTVTDFVAAGNYNDGYFFTDGNGRYAAWLMDNFSSGLGYTDYLNHYSANIKDSEAGLQLAIWAAIYNFDGSSFSGTQFVFTDSNGNPVTSGDVFNYYTYYMNELVSAARQQAISDLNYLVAVLENGQDIIIKSVPEPATMLLMGVGLLGLAGVGRKKLKAKF